MWGLLLSTILTSAADSLNPIAITQQFALQGMVRRPGHIWYFILPTGITNLIGGFLVYYGLAALIGRFWGAIMARYGQVLLIAELISGLCLLILAGFLLQSGKIAALERRMNALTADTAGDRDENRVMRGIQSVSPAALIALGVGATISELMTALPYFAFLGILLSHRLTPAQAAFVLVLYNFIYMSPLMLMYFIYIGAQDRFDRLYRRIRAQVSKWSGVLGPAVAFLAGILLIFHSLSLLAISG